MHSLVIWLCLLSFGLDLAIHSIHPENWPSSHSGQGQLILDTGDHDEITRNLGADEHQASHTHHSQNDLPSDTDHDQTHHLSTQLRISSHCGVTPHPFGYSTAWHTFSETSLDTRLSRPTATPFYLRTSEHIRTIKMIV